MLAPHLFACQIQAAVQSRSKAQECRIDWARSIRVMEYMKTITVNVSDPIYQDFRSYARKTDRKATELIREAMELYRQQHMQRRTTLRDRRPASVGGPIQPITAEDNLLGEMLDDTRD